MTVTASQINTPVEAALDNCAWLKSRASRAYVLTASGPFSLAGLDPEAMLEAIIVGCGGDGGDGDNGTNSGGGGGGSAVPRILRMRVGDFSGDLTVTVGTTSGAGSQIADGTAGVAWTSVAGQNGYAGNAGGLDSSRGGSGYCGGGGGGASAGNGGRGGYARNIVSDMTGVDGVGSAPGGASAYGPLFDLLEAERTGLSEFLDIPHLTGAHGEGGTAASGDSGGGGGAAGFFATTITGTARSSTKQGQTGMGYGAGGGGGCGGSLGADAAGVPGSPGIVIILVSGGSYP